MPDSEEEPAKTPCYLTIATMQKNGKVAATQSSTMTYARAHKLFKILHAHGTQMHVELWSETFNRKCDEFTNTH